MTAALLAGAALGFSVAAPFGPVSLICVQQSLNRGYRYGIVSGFGAATSHGIFAAAAIVSAGTVSVFLLPWSPAIRLLSALVLVWLGIRTMMKARSVAKPARLTTMRRAYASTLMLSLSNPMTIVPYLALATVAADNDIAGATLSLWSVPGVITAAAAWYACLSVATGMMRHGVSSSMARVLNFIAGVSLIGFGAIVVRGLLAF